MTTTSTPHFSSRSATPGSGGSATPTPGIGICFDRHSGGRSGPAHAASLRPARSDQTRSSGGSGDTPADDADRPTLRRRSPDRQTMRRRPGQRQRPCELAERRPEPAAAASGQARGRADRRGHSQALRASRRPGPAPDGRGVGRRRTVRRTTSPGPGRARTNARPSSPRCRPPRARC